THASDVPVVEEFQFVARHLHGDQVASGGVFGDAPEVGEGRPQRRGRERPRAAGDDPAVINSLGTTSGCREVARSRGAWSDPFRGEDLLEYARTRSGEDP